MCVCVCQCVDVSCQIRKQGKIEMGAKVDLCVQEKGTCLAGSPPNKVSREGEAETCEVASINNQDRCVCEICLALGAERGARGESGRSSWLFFPLTFSYAFCSWHIYVWVCWCVGYVLVSFAAVG